MMIKMIKEEEEDGEIDDDQDQGWGTENLALSNLIVIR